jgi:hypothetical protein
MAMKDQEENFVTDTTGKRRNQAANLYEDLSWLRDKDENVRRKSFEIKAALIDPNQKDAQAGESPNPEDNLISFIESIISEICVLFQDANYELRDVLKEIA